MAGSADQRAAISQVSTTIPAETAWPSTDTSLRCSIQRPTASASPGSPERPASSATTARDASTWEPSPSSSTSSTERLPSPPNRLPSGPS